MSPSQPPPGDPAPDDGALPPDALAGLGEDGLSIYVHVPFCVTRCGYCDFNTYTADELGPGPGASRQTFAATAIAELDLARRVLGETGPVSTVFFGGGTPTLLPPADLTGIVAAVDERFGLAPDAEVTTEANPESVTADDLARLREGGITRVSFGMQSHVPHVLATLDRRHTPGRALTAVAEARSAGFASVSLDLIYGTPGESAEDWRTTLEAALSADPDHISAYALIVEEGTALARRVARGELAGIDDDEHAERYRDTDAILGAAGLSWYEVSNLARSPEHRCRHNLAYWRGGAWWGVGPGAHSHVGGVRWWNRRHPAAWGTAVAAGRSPAQAREVLDADTRRIERVMLESRLSDGLPVTVLTATERARLPDLRDRGLITDDPDRLRLTLEGRLLADGVVRDLLD